MAGKRQTQAVVRPKPIKPHLKPILIEWDDSSGGNGWVLTRDFSGGAVAMCQTCGFLYSETDSHYTVVLSVADWERDSAQLDGFITIPKVAVTRVKFL